MVISLGFGVLNKYHERLLGNHKANSEAYKSNFVRTRLMMMMKLSGHTPALYAAGKILQIKVMPDVP